ncbi:MAG: CBS domain-containing protein [Chloroflexota bacterium]
MKVKDILKTKGPHVYTIGEENTLRQAAESLVRNQIGVLLTLSSEGRLTGIISERDILRETVRDGFDYETIKVREAMTKRIIYVDVEDEIEYIQQVMTANKIRHVPALHNKVLVGLISIGDVVKALITDKEFENKYLMDYISGSLR